MAENSTLKNSDYYAMQRPEIAKLIVGTPKTVLEIGCAAGCFKKNFSWPVEYHGVEPDRNAADAARRSGIVIYEGFYDAVAKTIPDGHFDLIVCNDVIEHMADPWAFLRSASAKLTPDGKIIGSIPNVRFIGVLIDMLIRRDWRYRERGVLDSTHLRFFTIRSFCRLMRECGYTVEFVKACGYSRLSWLKTLLTPLFWVFGSDILHGQIAFRAVRAK